MVLLAAGPPSYFCHVHFHFEMALEAVVHGGWSAQELFGVDFDFEMALEAVV